MCHITIVTIMRIRHPVQPISKVQYMRAEKAKKKTFFWECSVKKKATTERVCNECLSQWLVLVTVVTPIDFWYFILFILCKIGIIYVGLAVADSKREEAVGRPHP